MRRSIPVQLCYDVSAAPNKRNCVKQKHSSDATLVSMETALTSVFMAYKANFQISFPFLYYGALCTRARVFCITFVSPSFCQARIQCVLSLSRSAETLKPSDICLDKNCILKRGGGHTWMHRGLEPESPSGKPVD